MQLASYTAASLESETMRCRSEKPYGRARGQNDDNRERTDSATTEHTHENNQQTATGGPFLFPDAATKCVIATHLQAFTCQLTNRRTCRRAQ